MERTLNKMNMSMSIQNWSFFKLLLRLTFIVIAITSFSWVKIISWQQILRSEFCSCVDSLSIEPAQANNLWRWRVSLLCLLGARLSLPPELELPWLVRKFLFRTQVGRSENNLYRWGFSYGSNLDCLCSATQTMDHLISSPNTSPLRT